MSLLSMFSISELSALSHIIIRILVLLLVEGECAQLVQQSSGKPAVLINFIVIGIYSLGFVLGAAKINMGYIIGMMTGTINIILKIPVVINGTQTFPQQTLSIHIPVPCSHILLLYSVQRHGIPSMKLISLLPLHLSEGWQRVALPETAEGNQVMVSGS